MKMCKSHITLLRKVSNQLAYKQTMNYTQMLLGAKNTNEVDKAAQLIHKAIGLLETIE